MRLVPGRTNGVVGDFKGTKRRANQGTAQAPESWNRIRGIVKVVTMWAFNHGYISFRTTQRVFAHLDLRAV